MCLICNNSSTCSPYSQSLGKPTIQFAENKICGWIAQPANTWSNIAYLILAYKICIELKKANNKTVLWGFVPIFGFMGLTSAFYHASATFIGQFFDFGSIYLFAAFILFLTLNKLNFWKTQVILITISTITLILLMLLWFVPALRIWLFASQVVIFLCLEYFFYRNNKNIKIDLNDFDSNLKTKPNIKNLYFALIIFLVAWGFWWLDELNIWKDPASMHYINGHALWHILTAFSLYYIYKFYSNDRYINLDKD